MTKRKKWLIGGIAAFVLMLGVIIARALPAMGVQKHLQELRAQGIPTTPAELNAFYKPVSADENAALAVLTALNYRVSPAPDSDPFSGKFKLPEPGEPLSQPIEAIINKYLSNNAVTLEKLLSAAPLRETRYPVDLSAGANTLLPHLAHIKSSAQLLKLEAMRAAYSGESERAVQAIQAELAVANTLREEPTLISQLVRYTCLAISVTSIESALSACRFSDDQLLRLEEALAEAEELGKHGLAKGLVGERAIALPTFTMPAAQIAQMAGAPPVSSGSVRNIAMDIASMAQRATGLRQRDKILYLEMLQRFVHAAEQPFPEKIKAMDEASSTIEDYYQSRWMRITAPLTRMLLPSLAKAAQKDGMVVAQLRCARAALAVERFRQKNRGRRPEKLLDLVPAYLAGLPEDPFDGQPLKLEELSGTGYAIRAITGSKFIPNSRKDPPGLVFVVKRTEPNR